MKKLKKTDIEKHKRIFLFLDFDGTISQIVANPSDAVIRPDVKCWLKKVIKRKNIKVAIVSGRALSDVRRKVGLKGFYYAGNHGMEIFYNNNHLLKKGHEFRKSLKKFGDKITIALADIPGVIVEKKGLSVSVHFRRVERGYHSSVKDIVRAVAGTIIEKDNLQLTEGKMVMELRPANVWNKGNAVWWLWKKIAPAYFPVYIGDDKTDEDAFKALKQHGLTIRIGKTKQSHAKYYIPSIAAIIEFMVLS